MTKFLHLPSRTSHSRHHIVHNSKVLEFQIIRSDRRKKTSEISVVNGIICLKVPMITPIHSIESLIKKKANWIQQRINEQSNPDITIKVPTYSNNSTLPYLGKNYRLKIIESNYQSLKFSNDQFTVFTKKQNVKQLYEQWLYTVAMSIVDPLIEKYSQILNVTPKKGIIEEAKESLG